jgi:hypothetical protein
MGLEVEDRRERVTRRPEVRDRTDLRRDRRDLVVLDLGHLLGLAAGSAEHHATIGLEDVLDGLAGHRAVVEREPHGLAADRIVHG